ncbi:MAG: cadherin-like domain-containing protein [Acidimicrobiales bacterium]
MLANDVAGGSYPMTALLSQSATHGTLSLASNGGFTFTPTAGYVGPATFKYIASLGFNAQSTAATVTINVQPLTLTNTVLISPPPTPPGGGSRPPRSASRAPVARRP